MTETHIPGGDFHWEGKHYILAGKGRNKSNKGGGGVAIMIQKEKGWIWERKDEENSIEQEDITTFIIENNIRKNTKIIIIICYMTAGNGIEANRENVEKYRIIRNRINKYKEEEIIVMGDMNAHIGILGEKIDRNGESLLQLAEDTSLEILNITTAIGKITWRRKNSNEISAIDYIMVNEKCK